MAMGRPKATLVLDAELREELEGLANSRSLPAGLVRRAKIILLCASQLGDLEGDKGRHLVRDLGCFRFFQGPDVVDSSRASMVCSGRATPSGDGRARGSK